MLVVKSLGESKEQDPGIKADLDVEYITDIGN